MLLPRLGLALALIAAIGAVIGARLLASRFEDRTALVLAQPREPTAFPLRVQPGQRYLTDAAGRPFLLHGDAGWSIIADLTREEADIYLADRRARGFNTLLVNLLEHKFARKAPANIYGDQPFLASGDFTRPNEAYFAHAEWVLSRAREQGFLVLLAPAYIGASGGEEGWWQEMVKSGRAALEGYGRFLGDRFHRFDNIIWADGGDYDPPDKSLVAGLARALKEAAPQQLHTTHIAPETPVAPFWAGESWLDVLSVYTYWPVCPKALEARADARPAFLIESAYENEHKAQAWRIRMQAYHALLCGTSGQVFGNNPIWHFGDKGLYPVKGDWWHHLGSRGAQSMTHLLGLFSGLPWWQLEPDSESRLMVAGHGDSEHLAAAAKTQDGRLALIYVPTSRSITIDLAALSAPLQAQWFDPSSGEHLPPAPAAGEGQSSRLTLHSPVKNAAGDGDWVLILTSAQPAASPPALANESR
jgi:hypothetical protein